MKIENLIKDKIVANIKIGTNKKNGTPEKLPYFNVEEDKTTSADMVKIFKELYPSKPTRLKIKFTSERPFSYRFKRYVKDKNNNNKVICIGNGKKAITVGKDSKGNNTTVEKVCNEDCEYLLDGKCKLRGSLKFVLDGIEAGGVWKLNTSGENSLSNIASEIIQSRKKNISIVDVPFELILNEQSSLAHGIYYTIDLKRMDNKPHLVNIDSNNELKEEQENKNIEETDKTIKKENINKTIKNDNTDKDINKNNDECISNIKNNDTKAKSEVNLNNVCMVKSFMPTILNGKNFDKIICSDINGQDVEYILHPKADKKIISLGVGTVIDIKETRLEMNKNIICKYDVKQIQNPDGSMSDYIEEKLKKAV